MMMKRIVQTTFRKFSTQKDRYANTLLEPINNLKKTLPHRDSVFVSSEGPRWTIRELNGHSKAFANYLVENGFSSGNKIVFWTDINHTYENIAGLVGSLRAGLTIVHPEYENWDDVKKAIADSGADILVISPHVNVEKNLSRIDEVLRDIPELNQVKYGDYMKSSKFPNLKQVISVSHKTYPGTQKFKNCLNYAKLWMNKIELPSIENNVAFEVFQGNEVSKLSHADCLKKSEDFALASKLNYTNIVNTASIITPVNFNLGLIGSVITKSYTVFPGSYNFNSILKMIEMNKAEHLVCEDSLLDIQLNKEKLKEVRKTSEIVKEVYIFSNEEALKEKNLGGFKEIFPNANLSFYSEKSFDKI